MGQNFGAGAEPRCGTDYGVGMNNIRRLAFIGGGNMAAALIGGLTKRGLQATRVRVGTAIFGAR